MKHNVIGYPSIVAGLVQYVEQFVLDEPQPAVGRSARKNGDDRAPTKSERSGRYVSRVYGLAAHGLIRLCANKDPDNVRQSGACADRRR